MTHTPETLKAAEEYAVKLLLGPKAEEHFLAGYDYRQKEIDELVEALHAMTEQFGIIADARNEIEQEQAMDKALELIQKHKTT